MVLVGGGRQMSGGDGIKQRGQLRPNMVRRSNSLSGEEAIPLHEPVVHARAESNREDHGASILGLGGLV